MRYCQKKRFRIKLSDSAVAWTPLPEVPGAPLTPGLALVALPVVTPVQLLVDLLLSPGLPPGPPSLPLCRPHCRS